MTTSGDILVLGLGGSGQAVARFSVELVKAGAATSVTAADSGSTEALREAAAQLAALGVRVLLGSDDIEGRYDVCVASPGIPPHAPIMRSASAACRTVVSEIEFAYGHSEGPWVAVTGTNGKTTTTALIAHLLRVGGFAAEAVGNIGFAATDALGIQGLEVFVAEVSSFQLALTRTFHPHVAVLLNITPDHTDWHGSMEAYTADKGRIFANMLAEDTAVIDVDDPGAAPFAEAVEGSGITVERVSLAKRSAHGATVVDGTLTLETEAGPIRLVRGDELKILGAHNVSNALAAAAAAHAFGVTVSDLRMGLRSFEPIAHRLEPAGAASGVAWYNDSKATNPDAVFKAVDAFGERPLVVMLGGRNKGNDFGLLAARVADRAKAVVLFGEAGEELAAAFCGVDIPVARADGLAEAVVAAAALATTGDVVLLSPACASFDEFTSYEHRGDEFKRLVALLQEGGRE